MNIALGSAILIRMAKPDCGAPASGFIGSHSAGASDSAEASRNFPAQIGARWRRRAEIKDGESPADSPDVEPAVGIAVESVTIEAAMRVSEPNRSTVVRDMQDWLVELRAERAKALARQDWAKAEELQVEIAQVLACIDAVSESVTAI